MVLCDTYRVAILLHLTRQVSKCSKGHGIPREVRRRPSDSLRRVQPHVWRPQGETGRRVVCHMMCACSHIHWRSRSTCSLSTFYRLVHVSLLEQIFLFLKFNHLVHF